MKTRAAVGVVPVLGLLWASPVLAATLEVGKGKTYATIGDAMEKAMPGDVVEVQGGQTYTGTITFKPEQGGTVKAPVTVRGIKVNGQRPVLMGVGPGMWDNMIVLLNANHFVMESFEVIGDGGDANVCVLNMADDVTLRDFVIHNCRHQGGLVGNDGDSGSLTLEYSELYHNGDGDYSHQIYMATDEMTYPGSVFRMQFCYVHDGLGGNNVQSRAERNEIYYNWIEGAMYHELDLIGADFGDPTPREDSDIVGNVLVKSSEWRIARIGGDGSGDSAGRYRFANNTMVISSIAQSAITLQNTVQSLEMYNNVVWGAKPGFKMIEIEEMTGAPAAHAGSNNWLVSGTTAVPMPWTKTTMGADPGWVDQKNNDFRPTAMSPLVDLGTTMTASTGALAIPKPLLVPAFHPPQRRLLEIGTAEARTIVDAPDVGAFEQNAAPPGPPVAPPPPETSGGGGGSGGGSGGSSGCHCRMSPEPDAGTGWLGAGLVAGLTIAGRRRRARRDRAGGVRSDR